MRCGVTAVLVFVLAGTGCSSWGCGSVAPRADGPTPYARCAIAEPPHARQFRTSSFEIRLAGRELVIAGAPEPIRLAAFRGAAPHRDPITPALRAVQTTGAHLALVLGGLGDDADGVLASVRALAELSIPVLIVAGGRDHPDHLAFALRALAEEAETAAARIIDASALRRIRIGSVVWIPVPGAPGGRYSRSADTCGFGQDDLDAIADALGAPNSERRMLLSWSAPAGLAVARGIEGVDAGSPLLAAFARRIGASGGLHAFPEAAAGRIRDGHAIVPPIAGPALPRADGSLAASGLLLLELDRDGIRPVPATETEVPSR
jgi:hypothetical protein